MNTAEATSVNASRTGSWPQSGGAILTQPFRSIYFHEDVSDQPRFAAVAVDLAGTRPGTKRLSPTTGTAGPLDFGSQSS